MTAVDIPGAARVLGLTEDQVRGLMDAGVLVPTDAAAFWQGKCHDCGHAEHPLASCHELVGGGMPGDGPEYCPCAIELTNMEQALTQHRAVATAARQVVRTHLGDLDGDECVDLLTAALERVPGGDPPIPTCPKCGTIERRSLVCSDPWHRGPLDR